MRSVAAVQDSLESIVRNVHSEEDLFAIVAGKVVVEVNQRRFLPGIGMHVSSEIEAKLNQMSEEIEPIINGLNELSWLSIT